MQAVQPIGGEVAEVKFARNSLIAHERWLVGAHLFVAFAALLVGGLLGPFQTFRRAPALMWEIPVFSYYYQALTLHGVLNALVFTTFFIMGTSFFVTQRALNRPMKSQQASWASFGLMFFGTVLAGGAIIAGNSNVLYTFYPPLQAHWTFYMGLTLVIVGTWVGAANVFFTYMDWKADHPGQAVPLAAFAIIANFVMWVTASLGVAIEVLFMLLPLSLGWIQTTDPQIARILFWFFGHPLVYFWLIPAYVSWYTMLPKQLGVKLFSDTMARIAFLMIMIFSIPIGVHHLFVDPGVSETAKIMHSMLTFVVAAPSLLTAFNIAATIERNGRKNGATNLVDWMWKQPYGDPVIAAQFMGMFLFIFGGVSGLLNASFNINVALHNTTWVVGHFHTTLAGAVFLTYVSILFWIMPMIRERALPKRLALAHVYSWFFGMLLFAGAMGRAGMAGATRRTDLGNPLAYISDAMAPWLNLTAVAGFILLVSLLCLYGAIALTIFQRGDVEKSKNEALSIEAPVDTQVPNDRENDIRLWFESWRLWIAAIVVTNIIMWGPVLLSAIDLAQGFWVLGSPFAAQ